MIKFRYEGPVYAFDALVTSSWKAETYAPTAKKAIANLKYRFRMEMDYYSCTPLDLPMENLKRV